MQKRKARMPKRPYYPHKGDPAYPIYRRLILKTYSALFGGALLVFATCIATLRTPTTPYALGGLMVVFAFEIIWTQPEKRELRQWRHVQGVNREKNQSA